MSEDGRYKLGSNYMFKSCRNDVPSVTADAEGVLLTLTAAEYAAKRTRKRKLGRILFQAMNEPGSATRNLVDVRRDENG